MDAIRSVPYYEFLLYPGVSLFVGLGLNALVMAVNGGQMPVQYPGGCGDGFGDDIIHSCMTHATHLKFLCDWIVIQSGIASPGDMFIFLYEFIRWPFLVIWGTLVTRDLYKVY